MTIEQVDECLAHYREYKARCEFLENEIRELKAVLEDMKSSIVEDNVSITQAITGMPHGTSVSDPTGKLGILIADGFLPPFIKDCERDIAAKEKELRFKRPVTIFVEAWLITLNKRERFVIENKTIGGMFWRDLVVIFKNEFGEEYSRQGLKKIRDNAMSKIYHIAE